MKTQYPNYGKLRMGKKRMGEEKTEMWRQTGTEREREKEGGGRNEGAHFACVLP